MISFSFTLIIVPFCLTLPSFLFPHSFYINVRNMTLYYKKPVFYSKVTTSTSYIRLIGKYAVYLIIILGGLRLLFPFLGDYSPLALLLNMGCEDRDTNCHAYTEAGACSSRQE